jgi:hypothetical protein
MSTGFNSTSPVIQVEWYPDDPEPGEEYEEDEKGDHKESVLQFLHIKKKAEAEKPAIIPELAALAVYAQSIKPKQGFLLERSWLSLYYVLYL